MSPSHQVSQIGPKSAQRADPPRERLVTPMVALIAVLTMPARIANRKVSGAFSNGLRPFANRVTSRAPINPSSVLPAAMPRATAIEPAVVTLTRNAPAKMAGQTHGPRVTSAASAMPLGAQTADALGCTMASRSPSLPARK